METSNVTFATPRLASFANLMRVILNDGGSYTSAMVYANTSQSMQPKKNGCPYGQKDVRKDAVYSICLNGVYSNAVNKARAKELAAAIERGEVSADTTAEKFEAKANWHIKIYDCKNGSIVAKRSEVEAGLPVTEIYLLVVNNSTNVTNYYVNGKGATEAQIAEIKAWRADRAESAATSQGLENKENAIVVSTISFSNITELHANGVRVEI